LCPRWDSNRIPALVNTGKSRKHKQSGPIRPIYNPIRSEKCVRCTHRPSHNFSSQHIATAALPDQGTRQLNVLKRGNLHDRTPAARRSNSRGCNERPRKPAKTIPASSDPPPSQVTKHQISSGKNPAPTPFPPTFGRSRSARWQCLLHTHSLPGVLRPAVAN
jgi:hypothetical protein